LSCFFFGPLPEKDVWAPPERGHTPPFRELTLDDFILPHRRSPPRSPLKRLAYPHPPPPTHHPPRHDPPSSTPPRRSLSLSTTAIRPNAPPWNLEAYHPFSFFLCLLGSHIHLLSLFTPLNSIPRSKGEPCLVRFLLYNLRFFPVVGCLHLHTHPSFSLSISFCSSWFLCRLLASRPVVMTRPRTKEDVGRELPVPPDGAFSGSSWSNSPTFSSVAAPVVYPTVLLG